MTINNQDIADGLHGAAMTLDCDGDCQERLERLADQWRAEASPSPSVVTTVEGSCVAGVRECPCHSLANSTEQLEFHNYEDCPCLLSPTTPPPSEVRVTAEDLAGALALALHDAHPAYGNTAGHRGGIGGSTITHGCSFIDPPPGSEWTQYDLLSMPLRKWMEDNPTFDLNVAKDRVKRAALESIGIPVAGEVDRG